MLHISNFEKSEDISWIKPKTMFGYSLINQNERLRSKHVWILPAYENGGPRSTNFTFAVDCLTADEPLPIGKSHPLQYMQQPHQRKKGIVKSTPRNTNKSGVYKGRRCSAASDIYEQNYMEKRQYKRHE